ncbi:MAG: hypothetical protein ACKO0V_14290, partial [bacterium]
TPFYSQRLPIYKPLQTQLLPTPTLPRIQLASSRQYELLPPPGQTKAVAVSDYKLGGVTIVPFGYPFAAAHPSMTMVSLSSNPADGAGPPSEVISVTPMGQRQSFYQTANSEMILTQPAMFRAGFVTVGVTPTTYDAATKITSSQPGEIRVLNKVGQPVLILRDPNLINGPTAFAWSDRGGSASLFVANGINGVISRFDFRIFQRGIPAIRLTRATQIGNGFTTAGGATTDLKGPSGLAYDPVTDTLFVASTLDKSVFAIQRASLQKNAAGTGIVVVNNSPYLQNPVGVTISPSRTLLVSGNLSTGVTGLAEFDISGNYIASLSTGEVGGGAQSVTWQESIYGYGPEVVTLNGNTSRIQFYPITQN